MTTSLKVRAGTTSGAAGREIAIPAEDGFELAATLFEPAEAPPATAPIVIVAAGAAIARRFYAGRGLG